MCWKTNQKRRKQINDTYSNLIRIIYGSWTSAPASQKLRTFPHRLCRTQKNEPRPPQAAYHCPNLSRFDSAPASIRASRICSKTRLSTPNSSSKTLCVISKTLLPFMHTSTSQLASLIWIKRTKISLSTKPSKKQPLSWPNWTMVKFRT